MWPIACEEFQLSVPRYIRLSWGSYILASSVAGHSTNTLPLSSPIISSFLLVEIPSVSRMTIISNRTRTLRAGEEDARRALPIESQASPPKMRRVSVPSYQSVTVMIQSLSNTKTSNKRMRTLEADEEETLRLLVEPKANLVKRRRFSTFKFKRLDVKAGQQVQGYVLGQPCLVVLSSGSNSTWMPFSLAERLGLMTDNEVKVTLTCNLYIPTREVQAIRLQEVVITLEGGVEVRTPVVVLPKDLERQCFYRDEVILDLHQLCRGRMVQTFTASGSTMYIGNADRLRRRTRCQRRRKGLQFWVRREDKENPMSVMLHTGACVFYVSESCLQMLMGDAKTSKAPRRVSLDLGEGICLEAPLEVMTENSVDFVMGHKLLHEHDVSVDYARQFITFRVEGKRLRIALYQK